MILNKTDKRTEQYRSKLPLIFQKVDKGELPPIFENFLPDTSKLGTATDVTLDFHTLKGRFDTYYDNVRKIARELEERCEGRFASPQTIGSIRPHNEAGSRPVCQRQSTLEPMTQSRHDERGVKL